MDNVMEIVLPNGTRVNSTTQCNQTLEELVEKYQGDLEPVFMSFHLVLCLLSLLVSILNVAVLTRGSLRTSTLNVLLLALEVANLLFSLFYLPICVIRLAAPAFMLTPAFAYMSRYIYIPVSACVTFTVWISVVIAGWRYTAVTWPLRTGQLLTRARAMLAILVVACVCSLSAALSNVLTTRVKEDVKTVCTDSARLTFTYVKVYSTVQSELVAADPRITARVDVSLTVFFFVIPSICLIAIDVCLIWNICAVRQKGNELREGQVAVKGGSARTTVILVALLTSFLFCNSTAYMTDIVKYMIDKKSNYNPFPYPWNYILGTFVLGFVINIFSFFGYYFIGTRFRESFHHLIGIKTARSRRDSRPSIRTIV